jgi:hypothetical protein
MNKYSVSFAIDQQRDGGSRSKAVKHNEKYGKLFAPFLPVSCMTDNASAASLKNKDVIYKEELQHGTKNIYKG